MNILKMRKLFWAVCAMASWVVSIMIAGAALVDSGDATYAFLFWVLSLLCWIKTKTHCAEIFIWATAIWVFASAFASYPDHTLCIVLGGVVVAKMWSYSKLKQFLEDNVEYKEQE